MAARSDSAMFLCPENLKRKSKGNEIRRNEKRRREVARGKGRWVGGEVGKDSVTISTTKRIQKETDRISERRPRRSEFGS